MKKIIKLVSLIIALNIVLTLVGCSSSSANKKIDDTKWHDEELTAPGDVFVKPDIKTAEGAPIIGELSSQVNPGNSITVTGEGFTGAKAYVYSQSSKDNGKASEAQVSFIDDSNIVVTVDSSIEYGAYGIYLENENGKSNLEIVNKPKIWWIGLTTLSAGDDINVYGENLTTDNAEGTDKVYGYLLSKDGKYRELSVKYADPYKVTFTMPDGLTDGEVYEIKLHNGHGGDDCFAAAPEKVKFSKDKVNSFNGKKIDVTDYGADPADNGNDDTAAVQKAVASASDGDIIYFPEGVYLLNGSVEVNASLSFLGDGAKSIIINGRSSSGEDDASFAVYSGPCEFNKLTFRDVRKGKFANAFISALNMTENNGAYSLFVHNCKFIQYSSTRSEVATIIAENCNGIVISNNYFEATKLLWSNKSSKVFEIGNTYYGNCYTGPYYGQNANVIWKTDKFDGSGNKFYGKDILNDDSGNLATKDDSTGGRTFALQQFDRNVYIAKNTMQRTGLPNDNAGEQIMLEDVQNVYNDKIEAADKNTITISKNISLASDYQVAIVSGKGVGQVRYIKAVKNKTITLDKEWNIIPDSTSRISISASFHNLAIYNNTFDCFNNYAEQATATCAVQIYGNTFNCFITKNTMKNMAYGVCVTSHYIYSKNEQRKQNVVYWTYIDDNDISNVGVGIWHILAALRVSDAETGGDIPMYTSLGVAERNNNFSNITDFAQSSGKNGKGGVGILLGTRAMSGYEIANTDWAGSWEYGTLIEKNSFKDCAFANVLLCKNQGGTIMISNDAVNGTPYTIEDGSAPTASR